MASQGLYPVPDLSEAAFVRFVAGLRPCRRGGLRLESERLTLDGSAKTVVHQYGHGGAGITLALATAEVAADLVRDAAGGGDTPVAVLGAGVVGLATARELARRGHKRVSVYAERHGEQTTSWVAGAHWLPVACPTPSEPAARERFYAVCRRSALLLEGLVGERYGVAPMDVIELATSPHEGEYFASGAIARPEPIERLPIPGPATPGRGYRTLYVHTPRFLRALRADCERGGVRFEARRFETTADLGGLTEPTLVNCLALGSRRLFGDESVYPGKGMLVHMRPQRLGYMFHDGFRYMFPREDALVLGGCLIEDDWDERPDEDVCRRILASHREFWRDRVG
jgi:glycine/D-amino acid oxidase-like deaminating enzyme